MKSLKFIGITIIGIMLLSSCEKPNDELLLEVNLIQKKSSADIIVAPSGDLTGVTDANNIENALNTIKSTGGTVYLSDGYKKTTDLYYTSRNIVVDGFNGTLIGEGKNKTIINAGRQSSSLGFAPAYSPVWTYLMPWAPLAPSVLQLDNATGDVTIKNLSIVVKDDQPTDLQLNGYGEDGTNMWSFIEIIGGEHNTTIENVNLEGKESTAYGNYYGFNIGYAIHIMPWANPPSVEWPPQPTKGNLTIKNVTVENVAEDTILFMDFKDGSEININNITAKNVGYGITVRRIMDSYVSVSNVNVLNHAAGWAHGMKFFDINSGLKVTESQITNPKWFASVFFWNVHQSEISRNNFNNVYSFGAALALSGGSTNNVISQNNYKNSKLPGWASSSPDGPGAVWLRNDTKNNTVFETKFPNDGKKTLCEMIQDNGDNIITNWQACENLENKSNIDSKEKSYLKNLDSYYLMNPHRNSELNN